MSKYYPSAKSTVLGILIWGLLLAAFGAGLGQIPPETPVPDWFPILGIIALTLFFIAVIWFGTGYYLIGDELVVKVGPVTHTKVKISDLSRICRSRSLMSAPANSLKRLALISGERTLVLISPKDEQDFLAAVRKLNPEIIVDLEEGRTVDG